VSITSRNSSRLSAAAVPVVLTVALLAGCSSDSDTTSAPGPVVSDASPGLDAGVPIPDGQIDDAVQRRDGWLARGQEGAAGQVFADGRRTGGAPIELLAGHVR